MNFKKKFPFENRLNESIRIRTKYPDRIPIICEKATDKKDVPYIDKNKYLVSNDLTIGQFIYVIRKRLKLLPEYALFIFISGSIPPSSALICSLYEESKDADGFLYISYSKENTFGQ